VQGVWTSCFVQGEDESVSVNVEEDGDFVVVDLGLMGL